MSQKTEKPLTAAQKALKKIEEMGLNTFRDSKGIWEVKVKRIDPVFFFDLKTTPDVISNLMQQYIATKPQPKKDDEGETQVRKTGLEFEETGELFKYCQDLFISCALSPKFVHTDPAPEKPEPGKEDPENDILSINHVGLDVLMEHLYFQLGGAASVAVNTTGGDTTLNKVATFSD